jgi:hypothetical protein
MHDVDINIAQRGVAKRLRKCCKYLKAQALVEPNRWLVRADDKVVLHGLVALPPGFAERMLNQPASDAISTTGSMSDVGCIGDMRTGASMVWIQSVSPHNFTIVDGNERAYSDAEPYRIDLGIGQSIDLWNRVPSDKDLTKHRTNAWRMLESGRDYGEHG